MDYFRFFLISIFFIIFKIDTSKAEGGFHISSGGNSVQCRGAFKMCREGVEHSPAKQCKKLHLKSPVALDYFLAFTLETMNETDNLKKWVGLDYQQTIELLMQKILNSKIGAEVLKIRDSMGNISENALYMEADPSGQLLSLGRISDIDIPLTLPRNCQLKQVVQRDEMGFMFVEKRAWKELSLSQLANQQAILDFHEYIYQYAHKVRGHQTNKSTVSLVSILLSHDFSALNLNKILKKLDLIDEI